ncbi:diaminopimelate decarboxylase [Streptomyces tateyamensis]|uniref:Diaminopimelate decarboxylase n=1 Tax=Streptomyces tateyamensis TaxID=565073 RepID=A0A2V4NJM1_9ACTN|nr:diaminopimelate decarboxylase [Streptomyces tateyamensis]PYC69775.1 diaminopimelate decarboxylase [Streptomyces tateyamensis]
MTNHQPTDPYLPDPHLTSLHRPERRELILRAAVREGLLDPVAAPLAAFLDLDAVAATVAALHRAFPGPVEVLHAFAAKANSLVPVLARLRELGMGCEVASPGEFAQALAAGFEPGRIIYDSPAKTRAELARALELGVAVNIDNWQELARVDELMMGRQTESRIGVRVNPQVGGGSIGAMSTATATSKFGITLADEGNAERLVAAFRDRPWLQWLHCHVGSQGCPLDLMADGVAATVALAEKINGELGRRQVVGLDIGGGLPVNFAGDLVTPGYPEYVERLRAHAPALLSGDFQVVTEFGRSVLAKSGFTAGYVEYTKKSGGRAIAITSAGVQVATRTVFAPEAWPLRISAHDSTGAAKHGAPVEQDIAGPACFAGDLVAKARPLPLLEAGDLVALLDTGAYYSSTPFGYNSLLEPAVYGAEVAADGTTVRFALLRRAETVEDLLARTGA